MAAVTVFGGKKGDLRSTIKTGVKEWLDKHATEGEIAKWLRDELHEGGQ